MTTKFFFLFVFIQQCILFFFFSVLFSSKKNIYINLEGCFDALPLDYRKKIDSIVYNNRYCYNKRIYIYLSFISRNKYTNLSVLSRFSLQKRVSFSAPIIDKTLMNYILYFYINIYYKAFNKIKKLSHL
jgi:hypothetical protein